MFQNTQQRRVFFVLFVFFFFLFSCNIRALICSRERPWSTEGYFLRLSIRLYIYYRIVINIARNTVISNVLLKSEHYKMQSLRWPWFTHCRITLAFPSFIRLVTSCCVIWSLGSLRLGTIGSMFYSPVPGCPLILCFDLISSLVCFETCFCQWKSGNPTTLFLWQIATFQALCKLTRHWARLFGTLRCQYTYLCWHVRPTMWLLATF